MRLLFTALACLFSVSVFGQGWVNTYAGDDELYGNYAIENNNGGFICVGDVGPAGAFQDDAIIFATDVNGQQQWSQIYDGRTFNCIQQTINGGYIITGIYAELYVYLLKIDDTGQEQWSQAYDIGDPSSPNWNGGYAVQQTPDGGYIIVGGADYISSFILKTDENGIEEWQQFYGNTEERLVEPNLQQTTDGGYIITGRLQAWNYASPFLLKTDENGVEEWMQNYNVEYGFGDSAEGYEPIYAPISGGYASAVQQTSDGGYVFLARINDYYTYNPAPVEALNYKICLIKTFQNGIEQWRKEYDLLTDDWPNNRPVDLDKTSDGGFIILTEGNTPAVIKTDGNGVEQWVYDYTFLGENEGFSSAKNTMDGGCIIAGSVSSETLPSLGDWSREVLLIKTDSEGTLSSSFTIPTPSSRKLDKVVDALGREVNHTTNQILFHIYDDGSVEKKFVVE